MCTRREEGGGGDTEVEELIDQSSSNSLGRLLGLALRQRIRASATAWQHRSVRPSMGPTAQLGLEDHPCDLLEVASDRRQGGGLHPRAVALHEESDVAPCAAEAHQPGLEPPALLPDLWVILQDLNRPLRAPVALSAAR